MRWSEARLRNRVAQWAVLMEATTTMDVQRWLLLAASQLDEEHEVSRSWQRRAEAAEAALAASKRGGGGAPEVPALSVRPDATPTTAGAATARALDQEGASSNKLINAGDALPAAQQLALFTQLKVDLSEARREAAELHTRLAPALHGALARDTESLPGALDRHVAAAAYRHLSLEQLTLALRGAGARLPPDPDRQVLCCLCVHHGIDPVRLVPAAWRMRSNSTDRRPARLSLGGGPCLAFAPVY